MDDQPAGEEAAPAASNAEAAVALRASDADRERVVALLRGAAVEGRLTRVEFSTRVERALQARTHDELEVLYADLPATPPGLPPAQQRAGRWVVTSLLERRGRWLLPDGYRLNVLCGTVVLDLGQAVVAGAVTNLELRNFFSTVTILLPDAIQVELHDGGVMLTHHVALARHAAPANAPLVRIRTSGVGGTNSIRSCHDAT